MSEPGSDPIADFQRWLMKAGARSLGRDVASKVRSTMGGGSSSGKRAGVWETATTEPPGDEPPECQWCPICRAARRYRDSGGTDSGLGSPLPKLDPVTKGAWVALFGGPLYLLIATAVGWTISGLSAFLAVAAFVGGFAVLVFRMDNGGPRDSGPDDGAVV